MRKIFSPGKGFQVPDATKVFPLINCQDPASRLPGDPLEEFSLAAGEIEPAQHSKIHIMPLVTQVTFVLQGKLEVWMKDADQLEPYSLRLEEEQAILTRPGTFLQFRNNTTALCRVLYMVNPAYLYLIKEGQMLYDDSVVLDEDWEDLGKINWKPAKLRSLDLIRKDRRAAKEHFCRQAR